MQCIVSGFDAFGEASDNPSQKVVELLPREVALGDTSIELTTLVLPTCCDKAWNKLADQFEDVKDTSVLIVLTGFSESDNKISLERFALNIRDYRIADNAGHRFADETIDESGPEAFRSALPLTDFENHLRDNGFKCDVSNHAGAFVCNEVYYRSMHYWQIQSQTGNRPEAAVMFLHFPDPGKYAPDADKDDTIKNFAQAVQEIIRLGAKYLESREATSQNATIYS